MSTDGNEEDNPIHTFIFGILWIAIIIGCTWVSIQCVFDQSAVNAIKESSHEHTMSPMRPYTIRTSPPVYPIVSGKTFDVPGNRNLRLPGAKL